MRKTYKFNSCVCQGGYLYSHKTVGGEIINNKEGLRKNLNEIAKQFELIDVTIKIYDQIFFFFFMMKPKIVHNNLINALQDEITKFGSWGEKYVCSGISDLQEPYVRSKLSIWGFDYDQG